MVNRMRVPSSSSSSSRLRCQHSPTFQTLISWQRTNSNGLDLNTILNLSIASIIGFLVLKHVLAAEGVYECCAT